MQVQHWGRATRSIDHDTHGHRLGQDKAQAGFEGSQEAGALDEEVAIASTPSSVRLVSSLLIDETSRYSKVLFVFFPPLAASRLKSKAAGAAGTKYGRASY